MREVCGGGRKEKIPGGRKEKWVGSVEIEGEGKVQMNSTNELDAASIVPLYVIVVFEVLVAERGSQSGPVVHKVSDIEAQIPSLFRGGHRERFLFSGKDVPKAHISPPLKTGVKLEDGREEIKVVQVETEPLEATGWKTETLALVVKILVGAKGLISAVADSSIFQSRL